MKHTAMRFDLTERRSLTETPHTYPPRTNFAP